MFLKHLQNKEVLSNSPRGAEFLLRQSHRYLDPVRSILEGQIDKRLARTFFDLFIVILLFRNRSMGLLLSELGGYICGFDHAPAGTKRISNLLRSNKWTAQIIDQFFFRRTEERIARLRDQGKRALLLWDDSRIEKHESWFAEGLCSVYSSKGKRLTKVKRGFYRPPVNRICVPGFKWTAILLSNLGGVPSVCQMSWWTTRGKFKDLGSNIVYRMLKKVHEQLGRVAVHVMDRGYATAQMLEWLFHFEQDFIIRWKKNHLLGHATKGVKKTHLLARSFKGKHRRKVWDKNRKKEKVITVAWAAVWHQEFPDQPLSLVIVRDKHNYNSPMYILTSLNVQSPAQAYEVCFSYLHRWEVEQGFRFGKSELAMESPRLWFWENRLKLMAIVSLVHDFLLSLIRNWKAMIPIFLKQWGHRTGDRYRNASIPIYRFRAAISVCLFFLMAQVQNSG